MAEKLGLFNQLLFGDWAQRGAINKNADDLSIVEADLGELRKVVQRQAAEILQLRAMFMGVVEVLNEKTPFDSKELERAVQEAYAKLTAPPEKPQQATDPYRGLPSEPPSEADVEAAKALLASAQNHHFSRRFNEAREIYQQICDRYSNTKQAGVARQQLDNLRKA
jgi:hypothetical protein